MASAIVLALCDGVVTVPCREQLADIARGIATEREELPAGAEFERILDAAGGLTRYEAEGAFSLSLVRHGKLRADVLWEQKTQMLRHGGPATAF